MSALRRALVPLVALVAVLACASSARAADDPFFSYDGAAPLSSYAPGTVLKTRTLPMRTAVPQMQPLDGSPNSVPGGSSSSKNPAHR